MIHFVLQIDTCIMHVCMYVCMYACLYVYVFVCVCMNSFGLFSWSNVEKLNCVCLCFECLFM